MPAHTAYTCTCPTTCTLLHTPACSRTWLHSLYMHSILLEGATRPGRVRQGWAGWPGAASRDLGLAGPCGGWWRREPAGVLGQARAEHHGGGLREAFPTVGQAFPVAQGWRDISWTHHGGHTCSCGAGVCWAQTDPRDSGYEAACPFSLRRTLPPWRRLP